jgi:hypothetical protein
VLKLYHGSQVQGSHRNNIKILSCTSQYFIYIYGFHLLPNAVPLKTGNQYNLIDWIPAFQTVFLICHCERPQEARQSLYSAVGMPVTRHPPHRPVRALLRHTVPRLYSLPRKARPSRKHPSSTDFSYNRFCYGYCIQDFPELLPSETSSFAAPPVEPFECTV